MDIDIMDIQSLNVNLNDAKGGDTCDIILANPDNKYDELIVWDNRYAKSYTVKMGYNGINVNVFTGRVFISSKDKEAGTGDTLRLVLMERNALFENAPMLSERIVDTTVKLLIQNCACKYLGYAQNEIVVIDPDNYFDSDFCNVSLFEVRNESLFRKLRELAESFGGVLYNDADGKLVLRKLFTKTTPDIEYDMNHWIKWGITTSMRNELSNEIEIIGREKQIDEMVEPGDKRKLCCLGYNLFSADFIQMGGLPSFYLESHSLQGMVGFIGKDYICGNDEEGVFRPGFLYNTGPLKTRTDSVGSSLTYGWCIVEIPYLEKWGIPTVVDVKYYKPENLKCNDGSGENTKATNAEVWRSGTPVQTKILCWKKDKATILVWGIPKETNPKTGEEQVISSHFAVFLFGYAVDDRFVAVSNRVRESEIFIKTTYEDVKQPWVTNYYTRRIIKDPVSGKRLSTYTGVIKKETLTLPYIETDEQSYEVYYNKTNIAWLKTQPFTLTVPCNPLIERGDLVRVVLDDEHWCQFWVESIRHEFGKEATTTLNGYVQQAELPYDPVVPEVT